MLVDGNVNCLSTLMYMELSDILVCVAKSKGVLGDTHSFFLTPSSYPSKVFTLSSDRPTLAHPPSEQLHKWATATVFPKSSIFVLPHSSRLDLPQGLSVPCLEDERSCLSAAFCPAEWGSNVPTPFPHSWFPSSGCDMLPSVTQGAWGGLQDTTWGFLSSRSCLGPCSPSVFMWCSVLALTCIFSHDCVIPPTLVVLPFIFFNIREQCIGTPGKSEHILNCLVEINISKLSEHEAQGKILFGGHEKCLENGKMEFQPILQRESFFRGILTMKQFWKKKLLTTVLFYLCKEPCYDYALSLHNCTFLLEERESSSCTMITLFPSHLTTT